jgi:protein-S-isoprenylcysteine O-methyltransferase Ste14
MFSKLISGVAISFAGTGALLFIAAGTLRWPAGWLFLIEMYGSGLAIGIALAKRDPALLAERLAPIVQRGQESWDRFATATALVLFIGWILLMGADAVRFGYSHVPFWARFPGAAGLLLAMYIVHLAFQANTFAAPVVKIQRERGHKVITAGPYRYVRHPMYAGAMILFLSTPLLLGSWYGLAMAPVLIALLAIRALMEERTLSDKLDGYAAYATRVRYRLIPLIW